MLNFTAGGNETESHPEYKTYALVFGSVMALGLPLNTISLWILFRRHNLRTPSAVFLVNLAISDLLLVISLAPMVYFYVTHSWPLGNMACIWITMLFRNNIRSSSIFITFISVDRLLAVVYPLRSRHLRTWSNAIKAAGLIWLFVLVWNVPESVEFSRFLNNLSDSSCFELPAHPLINITYIQPALVFTMLAVNIVSTVLVSWTLSRHLNDSARINNKISVMLIFAMNLMMFALFFLPVSVVIFFEGWRHVITPLRCLASVNCCLDPLLYYFSFDGFWKKKEAMEASVERQ